MKHVDGSTICLATIDFDGVGLKYCETSKTIPYFTGKRPVSSLTVVPLHYSKKMEDPKNYLLKRGKKWKEHAGVYHRAYTGR